MKVDNSTLHSRAQIWLERVGDLQRFMQFVGAFCWEELEGCEDVDGLAWDSTNASDEESLRHGKDVGKFVGCDRRNFETLEG